ncbi:MAG: Ig-like domain-containing protein [Actinobacteria bacterium]|nr:Ig-like domain-containing protein [Actinomycetota bacterium]
MTLSWKGRTRLQIPVDVVRALGRVIVPVGIAVVIGVVFAFILLLLYAQFIGPAAYGQLVVLASTAESESLAIIALLVPVILLAAFATLVWAAIVVLVAADTARGRAASVVGAAAVGIRQSPRAAAVALLVALGVLAALVLTPLIVIAGIVGLIIDLLARPRLDRWPTRATLITMAVPFGAAVRLAVRWTLALPSVWLAGSTARGALADSAHRVRGREVSVGVTLLTTALITSLATEGAVIGVGMLVPGDTPMLAARLLAVIVVGPLVLVAMTVLYCRSASRSSPAPARDAIAGRKGARVAIAVALSLLVPFAVVATPSPAFAAATTVTLATDLTSSVFGQTVTLTATVAGSPLPTGTVSFEARATAGPNTGLGYFLGSSTLDGAGVATLTTSTLLVGEYDLTAHYEGFSISEPSTSPAVDLIVQRAQPTITVTSDLANPRAGDTADITVTVTAASPGSGSPAGTVTLTRDGTTLGTATLAGGVGLFTVPVGAGGNRHFTAEYSGDESFAAGTGVLDMLLRIPTTTIVDGDKDRSATYGTSQTYSGIVTAEDGSHPSGTVELWVGGSPVTDGDLVDGGFSITTDLIPVGVVTAMTAWVVYSGDDTYEGSDSSGASDVINLEMLKATSVPQLTVSPSVFSVGDTVTVTATLDDLGVGPTGWVTFSTPTGPSGSAVPLGLPVAVASAAASISFVVGSATTIVNAHFDGDSNFSDTDAPPFTLTANKLTATVTLDDPGAIPFATTTELVAHVALGDGRVPTAAVQFRTSDGTIYTATPDPSGVARLTVCAGSAGDCASGIALGTGALTITARYPETSVNAQGDSSPVDYTVDRATTVTVTTNPTSGIQGGLVFLTATVAAPVGSPAASHGSVSFYALMPDGSGGHGEMFLGRDDSLVGGVAEVQAKVGVGTGDLQWPVDGIIARYLPGGDPYLSGSGTTPFSVQRISLDLDVQEPTVVPGQPATVTVTLTHGPGVSNDYTERVAVLVDGVVACRAFVPSGQQVTSCQVAASALATGSHDLTASYPGDTVYVPSVSDPVTVGVGKRTPTLGASVPLPVTAGTDVTVTWNVFDASSTGLVQVFADGTQWCEVLATVGSCTGQFGNSSATGALVDVRVRFLGDSSWNQTEQIVKTRVNICATLDVYSSNTALGTVRIDTAPNCGGTGYLAGTTVTATALPIAPNELAAWSKLGGSGLIIDVTTTSVTWLVTNDSTTWVRAASFRLPCYPVTADAEGGGIRVLPASNCTTPAGDAGWSIGTAVDVYPVGSYSPGWEENNAFVAFGALPSGAVTSTDRFGDYRASFIVTGATVIPATFGPQCRVVTVVTAPASPGDTTAVSTPQNCESHAVDGFTRDSRVTVTAASGDPNLVIASWSVDGVVQPSLGRAPTATIVVGARPPVVTANFVYCYPLNLNLDSVDLGGREVGRINVTGAANCPDGSKRYLPGTALTLTPEVLVDGASFRGWDPADTLNYLPPSGGTGVITRAAKEIVIAANTVVYAGFYLASSCSRIQLVGRQTGIVSFPNTGCGPGYYLDLQKQEAARSGVTGAEALHAFKIRSALNTSVPANVDMDVYLSIRGGDAKNCFGVQDPGIASSEWKTFGPLARPTDSCDIGGDIAVWAEACQTVTPTVKFISNGVVWGRQDVPRIMYLKNAVGQITAFDTTGFDFVQSAAVQVEGTGDDIELLYDELDPGPCKEAGNAFPAGRDIAIYPMTPATGIVFDGWENATADGSLLKSMPLVRTTIEQRKLIVTASYSVTCFHLTLGAGISVNGDAPWCPGTDPSESMFIAGTAVQLRADASRDGKGLEGLLGDFVHSQVWEDDTTKEMFGYAYMDGDKNVRGDYPSAAQYQGRRLAQAGKYMVGFVAVAAPIFIGMAFPPAGILFAGLAAGAGISSLIPGGGKAAAFFDLLNPTNITQCAAQWAFNNPGKPTVGPNAPAIVATTLTISKIVRSKDVLTAPIADLASIPLIGSKLPKALGNLPGGLSLSVGAASFGYGIYDAGVGNADLGPQTIEQLNDTGTITRCLDEQWRYAQPNLNAPSAPAVGD